MDGCSLVNHKTPWRVTLSHCTNWSTTKHHGMSIHCTNWSSGELPISMISQDGWLLTGQPQNTMACNSQPLHLLVNHKTPWHVTLSHCTYWSTTKHHGMSIHCTNWSSGELPISMISQDGWLLTGQPQNTMACDSQPLHLLVNHKTPWHVTLSHCTYWSSEPPIKS